MLLTSLGYAQLSGSGTEADPYQVRTADDLFDIRTNLSAHYVLMNDIDLTEWIAEETPVNGWLPISTFKGSFDGNGKTISGLTINRTNDNNIGLFGSVSNATLKNLTIESPIITGGSNVGSLAGEVSGTTVENITIVTPTINGNNNISSYCGGLFGSFSGTISNVNVIRPVVQATWFHVGGLIGHLSSNISNITITEPHVTGHSAVGGIAGSANEDVRDIIVINPVIVANSGSAGGIIGYWAAEGASIRNKTIYNNYVIGGIIQGKDKVGGIIGEGYRSIKDVTSHDYTYSLNRNYSSATVIGNNGVGGICGYIRSTHIKSSDRNYFEKANLLYNRSDGNIYGNNYVGGICGEIEVEQESAILNINYLTGSFNQNIATGNIYGRYMVSGVFGFISETSRNEASISKNLNVSSLISASSFNGSSGRPCRIGFSGTNYALNTTVLMEMNQQIEVEDGGNNGTGYGLRTLKRKNTYIGFGYDFNSTWAMVEGESFPYNISQSMPATIETCTSGIDATVSGTANGNGKIYVFVKDRMIEGVVTDGLWNVRLGEVSEGDTVKVSVETEGMKPSIMVSTEAVHVANSVIELDENSTEVPASASNVDVQVLRTIKADEWSTICLPFTATGEQVKQAWGEDVQLASFTGWESEEDGTGAIVAINVMFSSANPADGIPANTPMLIKVSKAAETATFDGVTIEPEEEPMVQVGKKASERGRFYGTYKKTIVPEENMFLSGNKFWYSTGKTTIKGYRGYFEFRDVLDAYYDGSEVKVYMFIDEDATGISKSFPSGENLGEAYNLAGQRVAGNYKGIVIENGKKILK